MDACPCLGCAAPARRRAFLGAAAGLALAAATGGLGQAHASAPLVFSPHQPAPGAALPEPAPEPPALGHIPPDFWQRPRELWLYRNETREQVRAVYYARGQLQAEGYWKICALMRDIHQNVMTAVDPGLLDVLRGISGYYEAWRWNQPLVINSGFRTEKTNARLLREGAARNSLHLSGRAADIWMPGIAVRDVGLLAQHFQQGGVGFYPSKRFIHVDTGRVRTWRG